MRRLSPTVWALTVFWSLYAVAAAWTLYRSTMPVARDLLLILAAYSAVAAMVTGVVALRVWFVRHHRCSKDRARSDSAPPAG